MKLLPLGDQAVLAYLEDESAAFQFASQVRAAKPAWLLDVVQAYASVAVFFDLERIRSSAASDWLARLHENSSRQAAAPPGRLHCIPCCYDLQLDLPRIGRHTGLDSPEIVRQHSATEYPVYAIGFCPGFPYLGYLPTALSGVPRLETPRLRVDSGSVGLTGRQTGIYTEARPGGWNIIGRTPLELVHVADGYFPLRTGDRVRFEPVSHSEFCRRQGERL